MVTDVKTHCVDFIGFESCCMLQIVANFHGKSSIILSYFPLCYIKVPDRIKKEIISFVSDFKKGYSP